MTTNLISKILILPEGRIIKTAAQLLSKSYIQSETQEKSGAKRKSEENFARILNFI